MEAYKERMVKEFKELDTKVHKLDSFLKDKEKTKDISLYKYNLMILQLDSMKHYETILIMRMVAENIDVLELSKDIIIK